MKKIATGKKLKRSSSCSSSSSLYVYLSNTRLVPSSIILSFRLSSSYVGGLAIFFSIPGMLLVLCTQVLLRLLYILDCVILSTTRSVICQQRKPTTTGFSSEYSYAWADQWWAWWFYWLCAHGEFFSKNYHFFQITKLYSSFPHSMIIRKVR